MDTEVRLRVHVETLTGQPIETVSRQVTIDVPESPLREALTIDTTLTFGGKRYAVPLTLPAGTQLPAGSTISYPVRVMPKHVEETTVERDGGGRVVSGKRSVYPT